MKKLGTVPNMKFHFAHSSLVPADIVDGLNREGDRNDDRRSCGCVTKPWQ